MDVHTIELVLCTLNKDNNKYMGRDATQYIDSIKILILCIALHR